jgi:hypothetical protein
MAALYWFQDPINTILYPGDIDVICPTGDMTYAEKITALVRLSIYIGLLLAMLDYRFLLIPATTMIITVILYYYRNENYADYAQRLMAAEGRHNALDDRGPDMSCMQAEEEPTANNPFMNPLPYDSRRRGPASPVSRPDIMSKMAAEYNKGAVNDAGDIYGRNNGMRQFYTVANTTFPNKQIEFAKWLYGTPATCKEGSGVRCYQQKYNMPGFTAK